MSRPDEADAPPRAPARRAWRLVAGSVSKALLWPRLQLAAKAGLAAGIAYFIAPFMPGSAADYPYYAPLGALVAMYENVAGSIRQGLQTLVGLGLGIGLAFLLFSRGNPSPFTVAIVMGLGVVLAGLPRLGSGGDWIPTAALLVLLVGGHDQDRFSFGYLLQMGVGVTVGIMVNLLVFPPLHFRAATLSIAELRLALARQLGDMAAALRESWPPQREDWSRRSEKLALSARSVRQAVQKADISRQANPRRVRYPHDLERDYRHLRELESLTFHVQDVTQVLADVIWDQDTPFVVPAEYTEPLARALADVGAALKALTDEDPKHRVDRTAQASGAVTSLADVVAAGPSTDDAPGAVESILLSLHRMMRIVNAHQA
ncbi:MAG: aromatic acid exporter family protein [Arthrobacter oryzae]